MMTPRRLSALRSVTRIIPAVGCTLGVLSCAHDPSARDERAPPVTLAEPTPAQTPSTPQSTELFPFVRRLGDGAVEIDGIVPIDCHHPDTPDIFLEVVACSPDTREHEALVMTRARPSEVHAALLMDNLLPGAPGAWIWDGGNNPSYRAPTGDELQVLLRYTKPDGTIDTRPVREWIVDVDTGQSLPASPFLFCGSRFVTYKGHEVYDADYAGNIIGLATFGNEVVSWSETFSPESAIDAPRWIANRDVVPPFGTPVTIILRPAGPRDPVGLMR